MASGVNKVILVGNLGKDPDIQVFENVKKASFTLATDESYRDREGNKVDRVEWHNIGMWRGLADIAAQYLKKGSKVYIEGKLRTRQYQDEAGKNRYFTEVIADNMVMLDRREGMNTETLRPTASIDAPVFDPPLPPSDIETPMDDDLPF
ncbi:MAG: single-stranded DNA-binding protein [Bacteroidales bacterium]|jgi:single-strand DNA-binding protein|nr:single-stranded DNA-binding protein [Bacteroidales bacterium]